LTNNVWCRVSLFLAIGLLAPANASSATIAHAQAKHHQGRYLLSFEVVLDAELDKVWQIMTDYEHFSRVSSSVVESRIIERVSENHHRVGISSKSCILFFCQTVNKVEDIRATPKTDIVIVIDAAQSDFSYSVEHWHLFAEGAKTRIFYSGEMEPNFFIPPVIGPWLVKSFFIEEIKATAVEVESLAGHE
jgi:hypothetical protein